MVVMLKGQSFQLGLGPVFLDLLNVFSRHYFVVSSSYIRSQWPIIFEIMNHFFVIVPFWMFGVIKIAHCCYTSLGVELAFSESSLSNRGYFFIWLAMLSFWFRIFATSFSPVCFKEIVSCRILPMIAFFLLLLFFLAYVAIEIKTNVIFLLILYLLGGLYHSSMILLQWRMDILCRIFSVFFTPTTITHQWIKGILKVCNVDSVNSFVHLSCSSLYVVNPPRQRRRLFFW